MLQKGDRTKARILETAKELFIEKGYNDVTMKDVCDATGLSRGGLYRHFSSTADMMAQLMVMEQETAEEMVNERLERHIGAEQMLDGFLARHLEFMLSKNGRLELAFQQFAQTDERGREQNRKRVDQSLNRTVRLIESGQREGIFVEGDPRSLALLVIITIGGMRSQFPLLDWDRETAEKEMRALRSLIMKKQ